MRWFLIQDGEAVLWPPLEPAGLHQLGQVRPLQGGHQGRTERVPPATADPVELDHDRSEALGLTDHSTTSSRE